MSNVAQVPNTLRICRRCEDDLADEGAFYCSSCRVVIDASIARCYDAIALYDARRAGHSCATLPPMEPTPIRPRMLDPLRWHEVRPIAILGSIIGVSTGLVLYLLIRFCPRVWS